MKKTIVGILAVLLCGMIGFTACDDDDDSSSAFEVPEYNEGGKCDLSPYKPFCDGNKLVECDDGDYDVSPCDSDELCIWYDYSGLTKDQVYAFGDYETAFCEDIDELEECRSSKDLEPPECFAIEGKSIISVPVCVPAQNGKSYVRRSEYLCDGPCTSKTECKIKEGQFD